MLRIPYLFQVQPGLNSCVKIHSEYNPFQFDYNKDLYFYGSKCRRELKTTYNLRGRVQDHHIIPKSLRFHPLIVETKFPIHCSKNIKMMPSIHYKDICDDILVHSHHYKYNIYIKQKLDENYHKYKHVEEQKLSLIQMIYELDKKLNYKNTVPWI